MAGPRPAVWAHRGAPGEGRRENTVAAFREAVRLDADGVELDVRLTDDSTVVVHHDPEIESLGPIRGLSSTELPDWVPTLGEALDAVGGLLVNVELKDLPGEPGWDPLEPLARTVPGMLGGRWARTLLSSFSLDALDVARVAEPSVRAGWLLAPGADTSRALALAADRSLHAIHPHHSDVDLDLVAEAHRLGLRLHTWTVDDPDRVLTLADQGVDAVITNDVAMALTVLEGTAR